MAAGSSQVDFGLTEAELDALLSTEGGDLDPFFQFGDQSGPTVSLEALLEDGYSPTNVLEGATPSFAFTEDAEEKDGASKTAEQKERIKAKNRRAQNKYREKQKLKMQETEQQVEEIGVELERLRMENARMQHSNDIMQRVLHLRDHALGMLEAGKPGASSDPPSPPSTSAVTTPSASGELRTETSAPTTSASSMGSSGRAGPSPSPSAAAGASLTHPTTGEACNGTAGPEGKGATEAAQVAATDICVFYQGGVCPHDPPTRERLAALKKMSPEDLQVQWRGIVHRLSDAMAASGGSGVGVTGPAEPAGLEERISPILSEASLVCFEHAVGSPTNMQLLLSQALEDGSSQSAESKHSKWAEVMAALKLRPKQQQQLAALRGVFLRRMCRVLQERRELFARLGGLTAPEDGLTAMRSATELWLKTHKCTQDLEHNIHQEHVVSMEFIGGVMGGVLDSVQKAVAIVKSWPYFPDVYSISSACPALAGQAVPQLEDCCREGVAA